MELDNKKIKLSVIIPCYNEQNTLNECVGRVREIAEQDLILEIIIVDDCSSDNSPQVGRDLANKYPEIIFTQHNHNKGKGAALRSGFNIASGDFIAVQDADLEYDPKDLKNLLVPLKENKADVVIGSRFLTVGPHRVLYFWHSLGNKFLTFLSNVFSDLNLTDMEAGYKIFKSEVIKKIDIEEDRFGVEPEIIAKISRMNLRIFEMGISYFGRTYQEGKKIGYKDGIKALYWIFKYNAYFSPHPTKFLTYLFIALFTVLIDTFLFFKLYSFDIDISIAVQIAFFISAIINYPFIFFNLIGNRKRILRSYIEFSIFWIVVIASGFLDLQLTKLFLQLDLGLDRAKIYSIIIILIINFFVRKVWIYPINEKSMVKQKSEF